MRDGALRRLRLWGALAPWGQGAMGIIAECYRLDAGALPVRMQVKMAAA